MVECFLAKEDVAGSTPVSRSKRSPSAIHFIKISVSPSGACDREQVTWLKGAVPKW